MQAPLKARGRRRHQGRAGRHHGRRPVLRGRRRSPPTTRAAARRRSTRSSQLDPDGGKVLVISTDPGISTVDARVKGFEEAAAKADPTFQLPRRAVQPQRPRRRPPSWSPRRCRRTPTSSASSRPTLFSAEGTATGVRQAGKQDQVKIVGFDAGPDQVKQLKDGTVQALIAQHPYQIGEDGVGQAVAALGGQVDPKIQTGFTSSPRRTSTARARSTSTSPLLTGPTHAPVPCRDALGRAPAPTSLPGRQPCAPSTPPRSALRRPGLAVPSYDRCAVEVGVVHFGVGAPSTAPTRPCPSTGHRGRRPLLGASAASGSCPATLPSATP